MACISGPQKKELWGLGVHAGGAERLRCRGSEAGESTVWRADGRGDLTLGLNFLTCCPFLLRTVPVEMLTTRKGTLRRGPCRRSDLRACEQLPGRRRDNWGGDQR